MRTAAKEKLWVVGQWGCRVGGAEGHKVWVAPLGHQGGGLSC